MTNPPSFIVFDHLSHDYGDIHALKDFSLTLEAGSVVCLLGPSGCGKTTVLRLAAGLEALQSGHIIKDGIEIASPNHSLPPEQRNIGMVFQDFALFPHLPIAKNIGFGLSKLSHAEKQKRIKENLSLIALEGMDDRYPGELSGGQQQRVALARALAPAPKLILLDEPFSGLDRQMRDQVRDQTLKILKKSGAAVLMVTHDAEEAMFMADQIAIMSEGRIVQIGTPQQLYFHPINPFIAKFLGDVNELNGEISDNSLVTDFGKFDLPKPYTDQSSQNHQSKKDNYNQGDKTIILIRPEAVLLRLPPAPHITKGEAKHSLFDHWFEGKCVQVKMLGRSLLVTLSYQTKNGEAIELQSRIANHWLPEIGASLLFSFNPRLAFIFKA